jgi:hypothetical protein
MVRMHQVFLFNFLILLFVQMMCIVHESMTFHAAALHGPSSFFTTYIDCWCVLVLKGVINHVMKE